jgi:deaminated glutathione amidase
VRIALCQLTSTSDPKANLAQVASFTNRAADQGAELAIFPEATMACFGGPALAPLAEPLDGPWATAVNTMAEQANLTILAGMFTPAADGRVHNTLLATGNGHHQGYDKIHLFDAFGFAESDTVAPGDSLAVLNFGEITLGLALCYDVRFPELFRALANKGANAIALPASWGAGPGKVDQWNLLVRARALDSTSWLLACGQADPATGEPAKAPTGIGHSLVANPYGQVTAALEAAPGILVTEIDATTVKNARQAIPVLANSRL